MASTSQNLKRTTEKLLLVAHPIVAIGKPADVRAASSANTGQCAVLEFTAAVGPLLLWSPHSWNLH